MKQTEVPFWCLKKGLNDDHIRNVHHILINKQLSCYLKFFIIFKLIFTVRNINTRFSDEIERFLRRYFITLRRLNPDKMSIHVLPLL